MTKAQLDKELTELREGAFEMGYISDAEAFDIADGFITEEIATAIKQYYRVSDVNGFIANFIA